MTKLLLAAAAAFAMGCLGASPAIADMQQVRGEQTAAGEEAFTMSGDLVGDWFLTGFDTFAEHPSGTVQATGTELFEGCLDSDHDGDCSDEQVVGWLVFEFQYSAAASGNGRCHHPVVDAGGGFAGTTGQLTMKDRLGSCGALRTTYSGHLAVPGS